MSFVRVENERRVELKLTLNSSQLAELREKVTDILRATKKVTTLPEEDKIIDMWKGFYFLYPEVIYNDVDRTSYDLVNEDIIALVQMKLISEQILRREDVELDEMRPLNRVRVFVDQVVMEDMQEEVAKQLQQKGGR